MNKHKKRKLLAKHKAIAKVKRKTMDWCPSCIKYEFCEHAGHGQFNCNQYAENCDNCEDYCTDKCHSCPNEITQEDIDDQNLHIKREEGSK